MATPRPEAGSWRSTHSVPRRAADSARVRGPSKRRPRGLDRVATALRVLLRDTLRDAERPGVLDEVAHLLVLERVEPRVHPVVAHVGLARQRELLRLRLDERGAPLPREAEAHHRPVLREREEDDLA